MSTTKGQPGPSAAAPAGWVEPELATLTHDRFSGPDWPTSFARLQRRLGVRDPGPGLLRDVPVFYYLFDVLRADGTDTGPLPLRERKRILRRLLTYRAPLRYTPHRNAEGEAYWAHACRNHWEGVIAKRADAPYRSGRGPDWLKFKCENSQEFVIGGFTDPQGARSGLGALLLGYYDTGGRLTYAGKVGTGFGQAALASLRRTLGRLERDRPAFARGALPRSRVHWAEPKLVCQVAFTEWTGAGQLRHPRYLGLRRDKDPAEVTREAGS